MLESTKPEKQTLIEDGTEFQGTVKSTCKIVVNGRIQGELEAPKLDVTASGSVEGNIKADHVESRGKLSGSIDAGDLILSGSVGNKTVIKARNLEVRLSPDKGRMELTFGECTLDVGDEPTKERSEESSADAEQSVGAQSASEVPVEQAEADSKDSKKSKGKDKGKADAKSDDGSGEDGVKLKKEIKADEKAGDMGFGAFSLSRPPASNKKDGSSDSVPPGP